MKVGDGKLVQQQLSMLTTRKTFEMDSPRNQRQYNTPVSQTIASFSETPIINNYYCFLQLF